MKKTGLWMVLAAVTFLVGCESKELVTCREDNQKLQAQTTSLQQQLTQANATIEKQKSENTDIQNKAMESIMSMLKKEEDRRKQLQASVEEKDALLKAEQQKAAATQQEAAAAQKQLDSLKADLDKANKALETMKAAAAETAK